METTLTADEYDALELLRRGAQPVRANACIGRNVKRLSGLKLVKVSRDMAALTEKGQEVLFLRRCITALRALADDPRHALEADVAGFLMRKSFVVERGEGGYELTARGRETIGNIDR